jgi:hypothetical protein
VTPGDQGSTSNGSISSAMPRIVYHMTEVSNWTFIKRESLLSASSLLRMSSLSSKDQENIECNQRYENIKLPEGRLLRDQKPIPLAALEKYLINSEPSAWYKLLNSKVYFWADLDRLNRVRKALMTVPQVVLKIDTEALLAQYSSKAAVTPFNIGNTKRKPSPRSSSTLVPYITWQMSRWDSESIAVGGRHRSRNYKPVELVISDGVPDILNYVLKVRMLPPGELMI